MLDYYDSIPEPFLGFLSEAQPISAMAASPSPALPEADNYFSDLLFLATVLSMCADENVSWKAY